MGSWVLKFCGSTKFQFRNCGPTKFQFRKLWIHKKKITIETFVETQLFNSRTCGSTKFWNHTCVSTKLPFWWFQHFVILGRPWRSLLVGWEGFRVANATNLIQLLNWMRFVCVMLCRDFCKHWNGGLSWTGEYHPVTQLDELRLCDVLERSGMRGLASFCGQLCLYDGIPCAQDIVCAWGCLAAQWS